MADVQDPLPESNWLWRRVFCFAVTGVLMFFMWGVMDRMGKVAVVLPASGIPALVTLGKWLISFNCLVVTYYLLAPSAEQLTKMVKTASLLKSGVQIASRTVNRTPGRREETASTTGLPPAPPVPGATEAANATEAPLDPTTPAVVPAPPEAPITEAEVDAVRPPVGSYFLKGDQR